jgi:4-carboxymuconolactone decarboxylase
MPRVEPVYDPSNLTSDEREMFDRVVVRQNELQYEGRKPEEAIGGYFGVLMQSPRVSDLLSALGMFMRSRGEVGTSFRHQDREWIDMVLGTELKNNGVVFSHTQDAVAVGVRPEAIKAVREGREEDLTADERQLADYIRAVARGEVSDEQFAGIVERFGTRGAVEYTVCITWLMLTFRNLQALLGQGGPSDEQILEQIDRIIAGEIELPDPKARVSSLEVAAL